jgi:hypothetical protein
MNTLELANALELSDKHPELINVNNRAAAELRRLHQHELALAQWLEKTKWVQVDAQPLELGRHRADVIQMRIARLHAIKNELVETLVAMIEAHAVPSTACKERPAYDAARAAIAKATGEQP